MAKFIPFTRRRFSLADRRLGIPVSDTNDVAVSNYRPDIDGLRAIAVLAVIAFHYSPRTFGGGFVGVDIFFVISGFLISRIIIQRLHADDFSFADFCAGRIRRIVPALTLVLLTTLVFGWRYFFPSDLEQTGKYLAAGAAFLSNLALLGDRGYFDASAETKPLLHLWSLAIEEQFYIVWPLILWCSWKFDRMLWPITVALLMGSFALSNKHAGILDSFYSPASRAWELMVGALLAHMSMSRVSPPTARFGWGKNILSLLGLGLLFSAFTYVNAAREYPGWWALMPTIGAALLVSAGPQAFINRNVLSARPLVWIGLISYPLYLWHWPLLVFARLTGDTIPSRPQRVALLLVALLLAWGTNRFVEMPIRFLPQGRRLFTMAGLLASLLALGLAGTACFYYAGFPSRFPLEVQRIVEARLPTEEWREGSCFLRPDQDADAFARCPPSPRSNKPVLLLWGDSTAAQLYPGYKQYFSQYNIVQRTASGCRPIIYMTFANQPKCRAINDEVLRSLSDIKPAKIVLAGKWSPIDWLRVEKTIIQIQSLGAIQVDLIGPAPEWETPLPRQLYNHFISHGPNALPVRLREDSQRAGNSGLDAAMTKFAKTSGANYISIRAILCNEGGCLTRIASEPTSIDAFHLSLPASLFIVSQFPGARMPL